MQVQEVSQAVAGVLFFHQASAGPSHAFSSKMPRKGEPPDAGPGTKLTQLETSRLPRANTNATRHVRVRKASGR